MALIMCVSVCFGKAGSQRNQRDSFTSVSCVFHLCNYLVRAILSQIEVTTMAKKSTAIVPTMLRIREDLRKRLEREAKKKDHSLNAEMVERLEQSFVDDAQNQREIAIINM